MQLHNQNCSKKWLNIIFQNKISVHYNNLNFCIGTISGDKLNLTFILQEISCINLYL